MFNVRCSMFDVQCSMFLHQRVGVRVHLEFGYWSFFGIWDLELGIFPPLFNSLLNLLSSVLTSQPSRSITHSFRPSPFNPALVASRHSRLAAAASVCRAARLALNFGPCRCTSLIRCNFVTAPHFKSRFGSKLQNRGTSIIVLNGVKFTLNFSSNGLYSHSSLTPSLFFKLSLFGAWSLELGIFLAPSIPYKSHR
jgi:hypothetical protein